MHHTLPTSESARSSRIVLSSRGVLGIVPNTSSTAPLIRRLVASGSAVGLRNASRPVSSASWSAINAASASQRAVSSAATLRDSAASSAAAKSPWSASSSTQFSDSRAAAALARVESSSSFVALMSCRTRSSAGLSPGDHARSAGRSPFGGSIRTMRLGLLVLGERPIRVWNGYQRSVRGLESNVLRGCRAGFARLDRLGNCHLP